MVENLTSRKIGCDVIKFSNWPKPIVSYIVEFASNRGFRNIGVEGSSYNNTRVTALDVHRCDVIKFSNSPKPIGSYIVGNASKKGFQKYRGLGVLT